MQQQLPHEARAAVGRLTAAHARLLLSGPPSLRSRALPFMLALCVDLRGTNSTLVWAPKGNTFGICFFMPCMPVLDAKMASIKIFIFCF